MPVRVTDQEELQKLNLKEEQQAKWFALLKQVINQLGFEKTSIYKTMKPYSKGFALDNGEKFDDQGRIWYKLSDEDMEKFQLMIKNSGAYSGDDRVKSISGATHLVISMNPIDKFMCSTGHTFSSCMSLTSSYIQGYGFNIPTVFPNKGFYVCYLTKGEQKNYTIKEEKYRYTKMLTRNFLYQLENNEIGIGRTYPVESWLDGLQQFLMELFEKVNLKVIENRNGRQPKNLKHKFFIYNDRFGIPRTIYFDDCMITDADYEHYSKTGSGYVSKYWRTRGTCGNVSRFRHTGFMTLQSFIEEDKKLEEILTQCVCKKCGKFHMKLKQISVYLLNRNKNMKEEQVLVCPECLEENYVYCNSCNKYHPKTAGLEIINLNEYANSKGVRNRTSYNSICSLRFKSYITECKRCGDILRTQNAYNFSEGQLCGNCYNILKTCNICGNPKFIKEGEFMHILYKDNGCTKIWHCDECYQRALTQQSNVESQITLSSFNSPFICY